MQVFFCLAKVLYLFSFSNDASCSSVSQSSDKVVSISMGSNLAAIANNHTYRVYKVENSSSVQKISRTPVSQEIVDLSISLNDNYLAVAFKSGEVCVQSFLWFCPNSYLRLKDLSSEISKIALSQSGKKILVCLKDLSCHLFETRTSKFLYMFKLNSHVKVLSYLKPKKQTFFLATEDGKTFTFCHKSLELTEVRMSLPNFKLKPFEECYSGNSLFYFFADELGFVSYLTKTGEECFRYGDKSLEDWIIHLDANQDGSFIVCSDFNGKVYFWSQGQKSHIATVNLGEPQIGLSLEEEEIY